MGVKNKGNKQYDFEGDYMAFELLCDKCEHGLSGDCVGSPACKAYEALDRLL